MALIQVHYQIQKIFIILMSSIKSVIKYVILDQIIKYFARNFLLGQNGYYYKITSFFDFVYSWNHGISFGLFNNNYQYSNYLFILLNSAITIFIWRMMFHTKSYKAYLGFQMIVGGAIGNIIDRIAYGAVFDFLHFHIGTYSFPVFNIADTLIFIGVVIVIYGNYDESKRLARQNEKDYDPEEKEIAERAALIKKLDQEILQKGIK